MVATSEARAGTALDAAVVGAVVGVVWACTDTALSVPSIKVMLAERHQRWGGTESSVMPLMIRSRLVVGKGVA
jgi:hypothetical protein